MDNSLRILEERGLVAQVSDRSALAKELSKRGAGLVVYAGVDPTASSLHIGNLLVFRALKVLQEHGHKIIVLVGGGTGLIGDPTDKKTARPKMNKKDVQANANKLKKQIQDLKLLHFSGKNPASMVNNYEWLSKYSFLEDFIAGISPLFSINQLIKLKTFAARIKESKNLSLLEFMYPILQAWDFLSLFEKYNCRLQLGGNDQWANIVEGVELIQRKHGKQAFALTQPLLVNSDGTKMGKSTSGQIWLDRKMTSPFKLYQALEKTPDELVEQMLKQFTDLSTKEIVSIMKLSPRERQQKLALEIVLVLHGANEASKAKQDASRLFGQATSKTQTIPTFSVPKKGMMLDDILMKAKILPSKSEVGRRAVSGGIYVNDRKVLDPKFVIKEAGIIKAGKKDFLKIVVKP
ncbi:tyrosine--tRNA ligase [Patescibacteria group bacterium]|nr:tyrosine--tRNA ligase [Patescibacteria group bacterium]